MSQHADQTAGAASDSNLAAANPGIANASNPDPNGVIDYLVNRGILLDRSQDARVTRLTGGVSGYAVLVESGHRRVVVKRALSQLLVQGEWYAKPERAVTEAAAMRVLHQITPAHTPELLDADTARCTLTMTAAPNDWDVWKNRLLGHHVDIAAEEQIANELGGVVADWHQQTASNAALAEQFNDYEALEQLRLTPFHRVIKRKHPVVADAIETCVNDLLTRRDCLVHGDLSPKNVLVGNGGLIVIDFEVAHVGAAVFDVAFLQSHLMLKSVRRTPFAPEVRGVSEAFMRGYIGELDVTPGPRLGWHIAALLLARVDGTSRIDYLDGRSMHIVRDVAVAALQADQPGLDDLWNHIEKALL